MVNNILIINGNPIKDAFSSKITSVYANAAKKQAKEVEIVELNTLDFDPIRRYNNDNMLPLSTVLLDIQKKILWADHLVFIYPTWWGGMPAILKGFFELIFTKGFAFRYHSEKKLPIKMLENKSADVITTMDAPWIYYYFIQGAPGDKMIKNSILNFCGIDPVKFFHFDKINKASDKTIQKWLNKVENRAASL